MRKISTTESNLMASELASTIHSSIRIQSRSLGVECSWFVAGKEEQFVVILFPLVIESHQSTGIYLCDQVFVCFCALSSVHGLWLRGKRENRTSEKIRQRLAFVLHLPPFSKFWFDLSMPLQT